MKIILFSPQSRDLQQLNIYIQTYMLRQDIIPHYHITSCSTKTQILFSLKDGSFDMAFIDVDKNKKEALAIAHMLYQKNPHIMTCLLASQIKDVHEAFALHIFQYIQKPLTPTIIHTEIRRMIFAYQKQDFKFFLHTSDGQVLFRTKDILYIETYYRHIQIVTNQHVYKTSIKQKDILLKYLETSPFIKIQRSYLVNMNHIHTIHHEQVYIDNGDILPASNIVKDKIIEQYHTYLYHSVY